MKKKTDEAGICRLTGEFAPFVDSHILPKALTRTKYSGAPLMESTQGAGFKRRWKSWTDSGIVTRKGEDILSKIDDAGIKELRFHKLIWSSWILFRPPFENILPSLPTNSLRRLKIADPEMLWKFAISLLWRAAVSDNHAVREINIPEVRLETLKQYVLGNLKPVFSDFPVSLIQISTEGEKHNHSPILDKKRIPATQSSSEQWVPFVRFYVDGLIIHTHIEPDLSIDDSDSSIFLGTKETIITAVEYASSSQYENLLLLAYESTFGPMKSIE